MESPIAKNLKAITSRIETAARAAGRSTGSVDLLAISKTHPAEHIAPALAVGHRLFGENRVQEAAAKWPPLRALHPDVRLHLVGPLQTNKVRQAMTLFDVIETVDRPRLAEALAREMEKSGRSRDCLVEINAGLEPQKAGIAPADADSFITLCRRDYGLPVRGVMCIPPFGVDPAPHFALVREIATRNGLEVVSMGMSDDFETAIRYGATLVRVGTAIFGNRP